MIVHDSCLKFQKSVFSDASKALAHPTRATLNVVLEEVEEVAMVSERVADGSDRAQRSDRVDKVDGV